MIRNISGNEFRKEAVENNLLSLVQFRTDWSGTCQIIEPIYEGLAKAYKKQIKFFTVDIEKEKELQKEYGIVELPTILFFRNGEVVDYIVGLVPKDVLIGKIEKALITELN